MDNVNFIPVEPKFKVESRKTGIRGSGRTFSAVLRAIAIAFDNPGEWVSIVDHVYNNKSLAYITDGCLRSLNINATVRTVRLWSGLSVALMIHSKNISEDVCLDEALCFDDLQSGRKTQ